MGSVNTLVYPEDWSATVQRFLDEPNKWKDICNVEYTNSRVFHNPYLTDLTVQTGYRGTAYTMQEVVETDESVTIINYLIAPQLIDRADLAQSNYTKMMLLAERQGIKLNEAIETAMYVHINANATNFGTENLAGSAGSSAITVSATNIDDIIRSMKRTIRTANGEGFANQNGMFIVWRPLDLEILEGYMQANGFVTADSALRGGTQQGFEYMGVTHYSSNKLAASHLAGGVKKAIHLGICKDTYGQIYEVQDPGSVSGIGVVSRVDYAFKLWANTKTCVFDINVA
jgi:hypothetical protein